MVLVSPPAVTVASGKEQNFFRIHLPAEGRRQGKQAHNSE
jgi:hypothetical protein